MSSDLDVSGILESPRLAQDVETLCHNPVYYRLRRWIEAERTNPMRALRLARGIGWMIGEKLAQDIGEKH